MDGGGSNSTSSMMMAFGDNSNGLCPMIMMMMLPHITSTAPSHHQYPNVNAAADSLSNTPFSVLPSNNNNNINLPDPNGGSNINSNSSSGWFLMDNNFDRTNSTTSAVRAKIMAHPHYHRLLAAYANCQKVGAPPQVVARLDDACASAATMGQPQPGTGGSIGEDPALDQFMEAYCEILIKYEQELSKPFKEAMLFLQRVECQFKALTISSPNSGVPPGFDAIIVSSVTSEVHDVASGDANDRSGSSEEEVDVNKNSFIDPQAEDEELKGKLLRRYSGYLGSLKQEFMKKRKKGKLPKEARQQLLDWWSRHYKWPYPSESQKLALAESTGLDQKQINNWFINQRKRHWKPSEDMQFMATDANHPHYYIENIMGSPFPMDFSPTLL